VNEDDGINNEIAKNAATLGANKSTEGHVGFRFNGGTRDELDWWKINYTGTSDLSVTLTWEPRICCGNQYVYLKVYDDTAAAPIYNQYSNSGTLAANFTGLEKQYYYVQVITFYNTEWAAYNLTPTFTQKEKAKITLLSSTVGTDCSNGALEYKCTKSEKPYTVQLFQFGKKYGNPINVKNSNPFTIGSLPAGSYYATVYGDGATGQGKGTSVTTSIVPVPTGLSTSKIKSNKAQLNWDTLVCIDYDSVYYRVQGTTTWTKKETGNNNSGYTISGLAASTTYEWKVAHVAAESGETATSSYSAIVTFTTKALKLGEGEMNSVEELTVYPNPAASATTLHFSTVYGGEVTLKLFDAVGHSIDAWTLLSEDGEYVQEINLSGLASGLYYVRVMSEGTDQTIKIVKQ
ncbi:MAG: T9SS type A sorting domain-containing protein, partial [Chitinophagales bacterium]